MSTRSVSRANKVAILRHLRGHGDCARADIAAATRLSTATVSRLVTALVHDGVVLDAGASRATGGRPTNYVRLNRAAAVCVAIDVLADATHVAVVDLGANLMTHDVHHVTPGAPTDRVRRTVDIATAAVQWCADRGLRCIGIGVSVPGPVDDGGTVDIAPALAWRRVALGPALGRATGLPVVVENDANLIALGEYRHGSARGARSLVSVAVFDGIGAGIIVDGKIWRGTNGASGQLGRMLLTTGALGHAYQGFGDLESQLGASGIVRKAVSAGLVPAGAPNALDTFRAQLADGDERARRLLDAILDEFSVALANVCALLDPECIVFSGLFARWAQWVIPALDERLTHHVLHPPTLRGATPGLAAALIGASEAAFDAFGSVTHLV